MTGAETGKGGARRVGAQVVPSGLGLALGSLALPFLGPFGALAVGAGVWALAAALLARVRRHPVARRLYRVLLLAHVVFWGWHGLAGSVPRPPAPPDPPEAVAWAAPGPFRAGVADAPFDLPPGTTLAGWGSPPRRRAWPAFLGLGVLGRLSLDLSGPPEGGTAPRSPLFHAPDRPGEVLGARALVLLPDGDGPAFALVRVDAIGVDSSLADAVLARVRGVRLAPATLVLAATHTHTGPGGLLDAPIAESIAADLHDPRVAEAVLAAVTRAIEAAAASARPARIAFPVSRDRGAGGTPILAQNRTLAPDEIDDRVLGIRVEDRATGEAVAVVVHVAVQPVILRRKHTAFDRDLAGAIEDAVSERLPGRPPVLFVNGAMGDVSPRGTFGSGAEAKRALAAAFADRVAPDLSAGPAFPHLGLSAARVRRDLGSPFTFASVGPRSAFLDRVVTSAWGDEPPEILAAILSVPVNVLVWSQGIPEGRVGFTFEGAAGALAVLDEGAGPRKRSFGALLLSAADPASPGAGARLPVLWQPGLPTQRVGRAWRVAVEARGLPAPFVVAPANDIAGYVTTEEEYDRDSYEAYSSLFGRDGARRFAEALEAAAAAAFPPGR